MSQEGAYATVSGFGWQWQRFDQQARTAAGLRRTFDTYSRSFPWDQVMIGATGVDLGKRIEHRYSKSQAIDLMESAGLSSVAVSPGYPSGASSG